MSDTPRPKAEMDARDVATIRIAQLERELATARADSKEHAALAEQCGQERVKLQVELAARVPEGKLHAPTLREAARICDVTTITRQECVDKLRALAAAQERKP